MHLGRRVTEIDRREQRVRLDDGTMLPYDALLLATGSRPRTPAAPGAELARRALPAHHRRCRPHPRRRAPPAGAWSSSAAATSVSKSPPPRASSACEVTVLEMAERVMNRVTCAEGVRVLRERARAPRRAHPLQRERSARSPAMPRSGRVRAVLTEDGAEHPADVVIVGVGVVPADELATAAGLECDNGIVVDEHCRTSRSGDLRRRRLRQSSRVRTTAGACAWSRSTTPSSRARRAALNLLGTADGARQGALVLVGSVRPEAHHRRHLARLRHGGPARHAGGAQLQRLLPARRRTHRHRHRQQPQGPDGGAQAHRRARAAEPRQARRSRASRSRTRCEGRSAFSAARPADPWRRPADPGCASTSATSPSLSARTVVSIFMASSVSSTSPRATFAPDAPP